MRTVLMSMLLVVGCGGRTSPATKPASDEVCPAAPVGQALGRPCAKEGKSCGADACKDATGFCNVIVCRGGTWSNVEVPPPPPP